MSRIDTLMWLKLWQCLTISRNYQSLELIIAHYKTLILWYILFSLKTGIIFVIYLKKVNPM